MTAEGAFTPDSDVDRIFGPVLHAQTYRNLLYSFIEFPLGLFYFVSMIVGLSLGLGTMVIVIGFALVAFTLILARGFTSLERELTKSLLGALLKDRAPAPRGFRGTFLDRASWISVMYLVLRFPLGIAGFVSSVLMLAAIPAMAAPLLYMVVPIWVADERIVTSEEAILVSLFGCVFFLLAAHLVNAVAGVSRKMAEAML